MKLNVHLNININAKKQMWGYVAGSVKKRNNFVTD